MMEESVRRLFAGNYTDEERAELLASFKAGMEKTEADFPIDNPYWDLVKGDVSVDRHRMSFCVGNLMDRILNGEDIDKDLLAWHKEEIIVKHSFTITDPLTVAFVAAHSKGKLIDPMAGTAYWGYLLGQLGVDVINYDQNPGDNIWHNGLWAPMWKLDGEEAVKKHPDRTLLLSWPPRTNAGHRILRAYAGDRVIHIGERGGCTGSKKLDRLLDNEWKVVASHMPVQWHNIKDYVEVYERA